MKAIIDELPGSAQIRKRGKLSGDGNLSIEKKQLLIKITTGFLEQHDLNFIPTSTHYSRFNEILPHSSGGPDYPISYAAGAVLGSQKVVKHGPRLLANLSSIFKANFTGLGSGCMTNARTELLEADSRERLKILLLKVD